MFCKKCGKEIPEGVLTCPECGTPQREVKYCKHCASPIDKDCVICPKCGKQVEEISQAQPNIVINNSNENVNTNIAGAGYRKACNKWISFLLCLFLGFVGGHKFYEGKIGMGILYIFTLGLLGIGWLIDMIVILCKPNPYYV